jgi:hypothetical protein
MCSKYAAGHDDRGATAHLLSRRRIVAYFARG